MNRDYQSGKKDDVVFFVGKEIEHTPAFGMLTLFVVGIHPASAIVNLARNHNCEHVYLGANQSFHIDPSLVPATELEPWESMALGILDAGLMVTLDFDVKYVENVVEMTCNEHVNFIPQISVKLPYARQLNYNTTIKIDDRDFKASNPGVWCHSLHTLLDVENFTSWRDYGKDLSL